MRWCWMAQPSAPTGGLGLQIRELYAGFGGVSDIQENMVLFEAVEVDILDNSQNFTLPQQGEDHFLDQPFSV